MPLSRSLKAILLGCSVALVAGCQTAPPPAPVLRPVAFTPLGLNAPYLSGDLIGNQKSRAAKMKKANAKALTAAAAPAYMAELNRELRVQTAGIGLDVLQVGNAIVIRIPGPGAIEPMRANGICCSSSTRVMSTLSECGGVRITPSG